jgi:hypothetical protein
MSVAEMRMLRWMSGASRKDRIRNEYVRGSIGAASIMDKIRENIFRWFGHMMRREKTKELRINVEGKRGRPKKRWLDINI